MIDTIIGHRHTLISHMAVPISLEKQSDPIYFGPEVSNFFSRGSGPIFLKKDIFVVFQWVWGCPDPLSDPSGSAHDGNRPMIALQHIDSVTI